MLDEFGAEIEHADSRVDATLRKVAKVLHLSDGKINININIIGHLSICDLQTAGSGWR